MATIILLEPECVRVCCIQLLGLADEVEQQAINLLAAVRSMDWYGSSRDAFQFELEKKVQDMFRAAEEARMIAQRALRSMETMQEIDVSFEREYTAIINNFGLLLNLQVNR